MPFTMNGIGTSVCGSRGDVGWGSHDAMECLVVFFMPILPYKAMHTFDWSGQQYRVIPIRWSWGLVLRTYLRSWAWGLIALGAIFLLITYFEFEKGRPNALAFLAGGLGLIGLCVLVHVLLYLTDQRNKDIRRVLGGLTIGTCDPANFKGEILKQMTANTEAQYGTESYAAAVEPLLAKGSFAQAMWAARMTVAIEDKKEGERLTNQILHHPEVVAGLVEVRKGGDRWAKAMLTAEERRSLDVRARGAETMPASPDDSPPPPTRRRKQEDEDY